MAGDVGSPARTNHAFGSSVAAVVGEGDADVVEVARELIVLRADTLLRLQAALAHDNAVASELLLIAVAEEGEREAVVLEHAQSAVDELHGVLVGLGCAHEGENAQCEGHGEEMAAVVGLIVTQVVVEGSHVVALQRDEFSLLLHGYAQDGAHGLGGAVLRVYEFKLRFAGDGAPEVADIEVLEEQGLQRQEEVAVVSIARTDGEIAVEEAVAVEGVVELDKCGLEEVVVGEPGILVAGGRQDALLGRQLIVLGTYNGGVGPGRGDVFERIGLRSIQMVLQHERQQRSAVVARGNNLEIALLDGLLHVLGTGLIERHAECLDALVHLGESGVEEGLGTLDALVVVGGRIAHLLEDFVLQRGGQQRQRGDEITVHLTAALLQVGIGREEGVDVFHELLVALVKGTPEVEEVHVLLDGYGETSFAGVGRRHEKGDGRRGADDLVAIDEEIKAVHTIEVECLFVLVEEHLDGLTEQVVLRRILQHLQLGVAVPLDDAQLVAQFGVVEEQLGHVQGVGNEFLVHGLAMQVGMSGEALESVLHEVHLGKGRRDGRTWLLRESAVGILDHLYFVGVVLTGQRYPSLASSLVVVG